ncbi:MAG: InlB B-repeat-containing protein [Lachnospiraceae bacterium]
MKVKKKQKRNKIFQKLYGILLVLCLVMGVAGETVYAEESTATDNRKLQNGSFEEGQTWTNAYSQPDQSAVSSWNTTAFEGKIELFRENTGTYINGVTLKPSAGSYAAELNADEESTLYQNVKTSPSSIYEWGLDHGGRTTMDTMALVIGPKQSVDPSKPNKAGRDQLMQMVDWLIAQGKTSVKSTQGLGEQFIVYSKKFEKAGAFVDNAGNNAFSLTPSTIYTEEWHIWIMADGKTTSGENPWGHYGSNAESSSSPESSSESNTNSGGKSMDLGKYYLYTVPAGQTETLFGFVSVGCKDNQGKTYGNFLDNIKFQIYHPLSGSSTAHGSAVIGGSDGTTEGEGSETGHKVSIDEKLATYVKDGEALKIQGIIKKNDADDGCEFVGVYYTVQGADGKPETKFLLKAGNEIEDTGSLTGEQKKGKWLKSTNANGDIIYTYYLNDITSATDLHFIFIKSPTVTYDPNGGKPYVVNRIYNTSEAANVYSFKPATGSNSDTIFISPYVSYAADGQNDGWKFMGWLLTGDTVENIPEGVDQVNANQLGSLLLPAEHTIACNYSIIGASGKLAAQYFKIFGKDVTLTETIIKNGDEVTGVQWTDSGETRAYANVHMGLTMVAQWRWRQAFIPQVNSGSTYIDSDNGGTVEITSVTNKSDTNYDATYGGKGGKSYHATTDEMVTAKATAKDGFTFEGWYDSEGNLVTTNTTYSYVETKESVNTYYARFSGSVTQTYIRQVKDGDTWKDTTDDKIGTLGRYTYTDAAGMSISSTATAGTGYKFVGWYDSDGNKVTDDMLTNNGATISYTTTGDATYYARFEKTYTVKFVAQTKQANGSFKTNNVGGKVSVASVTDVNGAAASSKATVNTNYKFLGWYDGSGNQLSTNATYSTTTTSATNGVTYYARFEIEYKPTVENQVYLSFIAESKETQIPSAFDGRNAGTGKNTNDYGLDNKFGNTIATGFKYSLNTVTDVSTIQITVTVPASAYVKVGGTGSFTGNGNSILEDSAGVSYNKGRIEQISGATTLTYYWDATGLEADKQYGFIIDNLYAPGATATITVNGTAGTKVTNDNGVVNTASGEYRGKSHYPQ